MSNRKQPPNAFGQAVRAARDAVFWSQTKLAAHIGVSPNTIYRIESGHEDLSVQVVNRLRAWCTTLPALTKGEPSSSVDTAAA
jgi:ribosome-binding protein aMBF1 (putative translation factor)